MSYNSKYKSSEIEAILDSVEGKQDEITDLATIRSGAAKGATALQSEQYKGTITGVSANGTSVATSGVANIPAASTSKYGVTKLSSATNSTSTSLAATASAVKAAYDLANGKQEKLVSGTNIKTINGTSILGSGDIVISGSTEEVYIGEEEPTNPSIELWVDEGIENDDDGNVLDSEMSDTSENAVQNKVIKTYIDTIVGNIGAILDNINGEVI